MFRPELINKEDTRYQEASSQARDILAKAIKDSLNEDGTSLDLVEPILISSWS